MAAGDVFLIHGNIAHCFVERIGMEHYNVMFDPARRSGMSKNNLLLVFKDATGQSPIDFLLNLRLRKAAEILLNSDCNITETALNNGFHDSNYFTRQFRNKFGRSPRQYRCQ